MTIISRYFYRLKKYIISSPLDLVFTITIVSIFTYFINYLLDWAINLAKWDVVFNNIRLFIIGSYPQDSSWRPLLWLSILILLLIVSLSDIHKKYSQGSCLKVCWLAVTPLGIYLLSGSLGLQPVAAREWGGLILTLVLTTSSLIIALPIGVLLAIGRVSELKIIRNLCRAYIDLMRSFPLISILFFGQLMIPLFLPIGIEINRVARAVFAFSIFTAAYVAEDVRGGFQSIPKTQKEASEVLGLNSRQTFLYILIPQAIKTSLPALTNQAIGLLQNTSLMAILGLVEVLGISRSLLANPAYIGRYLEVYVWLALVYWIICISIALLSRKLEVSLSHKLPTKSI